MIELGFDKIKHETDSAYLIEFEPDVEVWLPKNQCCLIEDDTISCPEWLAEENEIEIYEV